MRCYLILNSLFLCVILHGKACQTKFEDDIFSLFFPVEVTVNSQAKEFSCKYFFACFIITTHI
jgi:hypothetical protein